MAERRHDGELEQRQVHGHRRERSAAELALVAIAVGSAASLAVPTTSGDALASNSSLWMPMCTWSASAAKGREVRERPLPAERLHHEVRIDALETGRVDLTLRRRTDDAEVDALRGEPCLARGAGPRGLAYEVGTLLL
jgi:hypothetical protein